MKTIFVTGGAGFVGANLARALVSRGFEVHLLNRSGYAPWRIKPLLPKVTVHLVDLTDGTAVDSLLRMISPAVVLHLAQFGGYPWQLDADAMVRTNYLSGINLLRAAENAGVRTFVNTGSSSEYGFKSHPAVETDCYSSPS